MNFFVIMATFFLFINLTGFKGNLKKQLNLYISSIIAILFAFFKQFHNAKVNGRLFCEGISLQNLSYFHQINKKNILLTSHKI